MTSINIENFSWLKKKKQLHIKRSLLSQLQDGKLFFPFINVVGKEHNVLFTYTRTVKGKTYYKTTDAHARGIVLVINNY